MSSMMRTSQLLGPSSLNPSSKIRNRRRALFALFIKLLLKTLELSGEAQLMDQTRNVITTCTRRNRMGDRAFMPLEDVIENFLRNLVGEVYWQKALECQRVYLEHRFQTKLQQQQQASMQRQSGALYL